MEKAFGCRSYSVLPKEKCSSQTRKQGRLVLATDTCHIMLASELTVIILPL